MHLRTLHDVMNTLILEIQKITTVPLSAIARKPLIEWAIKKKKGAVVIGPPQGFQWPAEAEKYCEYQGFIDGLVSMVDNATRVCSNYIQVFGLAIVGLQ